MPTVHIDWTISLGQMVVSGALLALSWAIKRGYRAVKGWYGEHLVVKAHVMRHDNLTEAQFAALARRAANGEQVFRAGAGQ